jgi:hypothetical protein
VKYSFIYIFLSLLLVFGGCTNDKSGYNNWKVNDGWTISYGNLGQFPRISFEYPDSFQKISTALYKEVMSYVDVVGNFTLITHTVEFGKSIDTKDNVNLTYKNGAVSIIRVSLHTSDAVTLMADEWKADNSNNGTVLDFIYYKFGQIYRSEYSTKQVIVNGIRTLSTKYQITDSLYNDPYKHRILTMTIIPFSNSYIELSMDSWENESSEVEKYYKHLLETFKNDGLPN